MISGQYISKTSGRKNRRGKEAGVYSLIFVVMKLTYEDYDDLLETLEEIHTRTVWPNQEGIELFESDPDRFLIFCIYLYEFGKEPETKEEHYRKQNLGAFIGKHLELVDDEENENGEE